MLVVEHLQGKSGHLKHIEHDSDEDIRDTERGLFLETGVAANRQQQVSDLIRLPIQPTHQNH